MGAAVMTHDDVPFDQLAPVYQKRVVMGRARHLLAVVLSEDQREQWFDTPRADLDGRTPRELVDAGEYERVLKAASDPRRQWPSSPPET